MVLLGLTIQSPHESHDCPWLFLDRLKLSSRQKAESRLNLMYFGCGLITPPKRDPVLPSNKFPSFGSWTIALRCQLQVKLDFWYSKIVYFDWRYLNLTILFSVYQYWRILQWICQSWDVLIQLFKNCRQSWIDLSQARLCSTLKTKNIIKATEIFE